MKNRQTIYYYRPAVTDPLRTLRLEDAILKNLRTGTILLLWQNDRTVVIGRNQIAEEEVDLAYAAAHSITVVRRSTGGGAVYHDLGNINYSLFTDHDGGADFSLRELSAPVVKALRAMNLPVTFSGRNDLLLDGAKICGTAARIDGNRILSHGCICFRVDLEEMERVLTPPETKLLRHGIRSVRSRVAHLSSYLGEMQPPAFMQLLEHHLLEGHDVRPLTELAPDLSALELLGTPPELIV